MRAATAAAAPPLEPPEMRVTSQGLRVGPWSCGSQVSDRPSSQVLVRPKMTSPARFSRFTCSLSAAAGGVSAKNFEPRVIRTPATAEVRSFIRNGTPRNGPSGRPSAMALLAVVVELHDHGVDRRVARLDALDRCLEQFVRRDLLAPHQIGESERVVLFVFCKRTHAFSPTLHV